MCPKLAILTECPRAVAGGLEFFLRQRLDKYNYTQCKFQTIYRLLGVPTTSVKKVLLEYFLKYFISDDKTRQSQYLDIYLKTCELFLPFERYFKTYRCNNINIGHILTIFCQVRVQGYNHFQSYSVPNVMTNVRTNLCNFDDNI